MEGEWLSLYSSRVPKEKVTGKVVISGQSLFSNALESWTESNAPKMFPGPRPLRSEEGPKLGELL